MDEFSEKFQTTSSQPVWRFCSIISGKRQFAARDQTPRCWGSIFFRPFGNETLLQLCFAMIPSGLASGKPQFSLLFAAYLLQERERDICSRLFAQRPRWWKSDMMSVTEMMRDSMKIFGRLGVFGMTIFGRPKSLQNLPKWFRGHRRFGWGWVCTIFSRCAPISVRISAYNCEHMRIFAHYPHHSAFAASAWQSQVLALYEKEKLWNHKIFRQALNLSNIPSLSQSRPQPTKYQRVLFNIWCLAQRAVRLCFHLGTLLHSWLCFQLGCASILGVCKNNNFSPAALISALFSVLCTLSKLI